MVVATLLVEAKAGQEQAVLRALGGLQGLVDQRPAPTGRSVACVVEGPDFAALGSLLVRAVADLPRSSGRPASRKKTARSRRVAP